MQGLGLYYQYCRVQMFIESAKAGKWLYD
ncbi:DUF1493 family protein [Klebsiella aerogenes]|nr:DUF1493 family protein [Klebsiella aerogenes]